MVDFPKIFEQTLRDGLMNQPPLATEVKIELIRRLAACGIKHFEVVRFPIDGRYRQFDDSLRLLQLAQPLRDRVNLAAFAVGRQGIEEALEHASWFDQLHFPTFVSGEYSRYAFGDQAQDVSLAVLESVVRAGEKKDIEITAGIGTVFGCPIARHFVLEDSLEKIEGILGAGVRSVMLGDTAGMATPATVREVVGAVLEMRLKPDTLRVHFHNTFGRALLNSWTACVCGVTGVDTSLLGLGGEGHSYFVSPDRVGNGNCATEEFFSLASEGYGRETPEGLECLNQLFSASRWLARFLCTSSIQSRAAYAQLVPMGGFQGEIS